MLEAVKHPGEEECQRKVEHQGTVGHQGAIPSELSVSR